MQVLRVLKLAILLPAALAVTPPNWNPYTYEPEFVTCPAINRAEQTPQPINLKLSYIEINKGAPKTIVMAHGWPSAWTTWRNQIVAYERDYHLIIPIFRGYGYSQAPADLFSSNTMPDVVNDIMCIMDHAYVESAVIMGIDFGAQVAWEAGRMRPDRFIGVFAADIPYVSSALPFINNTALVELVSTFGYTFYLSNNATGAAKELNGNIRMALRSVAQVANSIIPSEFLRDETSFLEPWFQYDAENNLTQIPFSGIMTPLVEDYMVDLYSTQGFYHTFQGYQANNRKETWEFDNSQGNFTLPQPTFSVYPTKDPVADWASFATELGSADFLLNFYNATMDTAHWCNEEDPVTFNNLFNDWIGNVTWQTLN